MPDYGLYLRPNTNLPDASGFYALAPNLLINGKSVYRNGVFEIRASTGGNWEIWDTSTGLRVYISPYATSVRVDGGPMTSYSAPEWWDDESVTGDARGQTFPCRLNVSGAVSGMLTTIGAVLNDCPVYAGGGYMLWYDGNYWNFGTQGTDSAGTVYMSTGGEYPFCAGNYWDQIVPTYASVAIDLIPVAPVTNQIAYPVTVTKDGATASVHVHVTATYTSLDVQWVANGPWEPLPNDTATSHTYTEAGTYTPTVRLVQNGTTYIKATEPITVTAEELTPVTYPVAVTFFRVPNTCAIIGMDVSAAEPAFALTVDWQDGTVQDVGSLLHAQHEYTAPGSYLPVATITAGGHTYTQSPDVPFVISAADLAGQAALHAQARLRHGGMFLRRRRCFSSERGTPIPPTMRHAYALSFDGVDDIAIATGGAFPVGAAPFSWRVIGTLTRVGGVFLAWDAVLSLGQAVADAAHAFTLGFVSGVPTVALGTVEAAFADAVTPETPWEMVATYDGTTLTAYLNGVPGATQAVAGDLPVSPPLTIGNVSTGARPHAGLLSHVSCYAACLTGAQVAALAAGDPISAVPIHAYLFEEGVGTVLHDAEGTLDVPLTGAAWVAR